MSLRNAVGMWVVACLAAACGELSQPELAEYGKTSQGITLAVGESYSVGGASFNSGNTNLSNVEYLGNFVYLNGPAVNEGFTAEGHLRMDAKLGNCATRDECSQGGGARAHLRMAVVTDAGNSRFFKGWLRGKVTQSNNAFNAICGSDQEPGRDQFRAQLSMEFQDANGNSTGTCYCNVCPREDGSSQVCTTSQYAIRGAVLSDGGACRGAAGTTKVNIVLEAVARDIQSDATGALARNVSGNWVEAEGRAIFERLTVTRCNANGNCATPEWY